jgi:regulator of replication initiation timing
MLTHDEVLQNRKNELFNEITEVDKEIMEYNQKIEQLKRRKALRIAEHHILTDVTDRGIVLKSKQLNDIIDESRPTFAINSRNRLHIEDVLKRIFENAGRPLSIGEIISELESFGYIWSDYYKAYSSIRNIGVLERISRGYYQFIR